ncbi:MAG TPA: RsmE family RNA methyltransferase, partial [Candidatus Polarisedimenticolia bacterium]|nr:RsmE family RNA methyltransferase [Candidatus Polarisedimenticolia bacterium]
MSERRFLVDPEAVDRAAGTAWVSGAEHRHLARVLRLRPGDAVSVFDGRGGADRGRIAAIERERTLVRLEGPEEGSVEPDFEVILAQAIPQSDRMEAVIQKTTELGVARIVPLATARGVVKPRAGGWPRLERWRRVAAEAARQSGRRR